MTASRRNKLLLTAGLLLLPVLFLVEEHLRGRWILSRLTGQLRAAGEPLTVEACRPPRDFSARNGYDEFLQAASMLPGYRLYSTAPPALRVITPGRVQVVLGLTNWVADRAARSRRASSVANTNGGNASRSLSPSFPPRAAATNNTWEILEASLAPSRPSFEKLKAALQQSVLDARIHYESSFNNWPNHLTQLRNAGQHFGVEVLVGLHHGRLDEALENLELVLRLCLSFRDERIIVSQLVRGHLAAAAVGPTWQALQAPGWTDAQLARLQRAWQTNDFLLPAIRALEMERAVTLGAFELARRSVAQAAGASSTLSQLNAVGTGPGPGSGAGTMSSADDVAEAIGRKASAAAVKGVYLPIWQFALSRHDEANYLGESQRILETARLSARQNSVQPSMRLAKEMEAPDESSGFARNIRYLISSEALAMFPAGVTRAASIEVQRNLAVTAIALRRFQLRHGRTAPDLAALVPDLLDAVPPDLYDGQPLRYRPGTNGAFVLYSIYSDLHDDQGDASPPEKLSRQLNFLSGRDLVWPMPASQADFEAADLVP